MKQILIILGLFTSVTTFAQSPRIKLNQITKDSLTGSVLISSPSDSGMVYSRDFYIAYGVDTVLILYGDTLAATSGIISSVFSDGVTITGDGTSGNELKVDTATVISTIQGLVDTLTARGYLAITQLTDTLDANSRGFLTAEVDGSISNEGSLTVAAGGANDSEIQSNTSGSSNVVITGGSNITVTESGQTITITSTVGSGGIPVDTFVTIAGTETISGAKTFTNTFTQSTGDANFDSGTLFVDESADRVGIGTTSPGAPLEVLSYNYQPSIKVGALNFQSFSVNNAFIADNLYYNLNNLRWEYADNGKGAIFYFAGGGFNIYTEETNNTSGAGAGATPTIKYRMTDVGGFSYGSYAANNVKGADTIIMPGPLGIGTTVPAEKLHVVGNIVATGSITPSYSDYNLKTNISDLTDGLDLVLDLKPKTFNFISDNNLGLEDDLIVGLIAQDVEQSLSAKPYLNSIIKQIGDYKAIDVHKIIPITVKAIQEQQAIIETQQTEIDQLITLITDLTNRLTILENK